MRKHHLFHNELIWILFGIVNVAICTYFLVTPRIHYGGDIIEYYGMTESILNHRSLELTREDQNNIEKRLGTGYLTNPEYYLTGQGGKRYAVHFPLYSILVTPVRWMIQSLGIDPYISFRITNTLILAFTTGIILMLLAHSRKQQWTIFIMTYLSPLIWFLIWPGPEVMSNAFILLSLVLLMQHYRWQAIVLASLGATQSQPLAVIPVTYILVSLLLPSVHEKYRWKKDIQRILLVTPLIFLPNLYYLFIYGTPLSHGKLIGVGLGNATVSKFIELYLDPNIGLAWYMPIMFILGITGIAAAIKKQATLFFWVPVLLFFLSLLYLTNTNWNSGTAGYGPTRYALPAIPFLLYFGSYYLSRLNTTYVVIGIFAILLSQLSILNMNNYLMPVLEHDKKHTPFARYILSHAPRLYTPTPELFIERTIEKEGLPYPTTLFMSQGICKKAYVIDNDYEPLLLHCTRIPHSALYNIRSNNTDGYYVDY